MRYVVAPQTWLWGTPSPSGCFLLRPSELYTHLLFTAPFFTGLFQAALDIFRWMNTCICRLTVEFFSHSMITGFMGGTTVIFIMQQLKGMLGLKHFTTNTDLVSIMCSINSHRDEFDT